MCFCQLQSQMHQNLQNGFVKLRNNHAMLYILIKDQFRYNIFFIQVGQKEYIWS